MPSRQALLLRGARQVGKTFSVREFAKSFDNFLEINFLENFDYAKLFQGSSLSPEVIIPKIEAYFGVKIVEGKTLLFLDEIQACQEALLALRFFTEKAPNLHVVAAGSLLEFALSELPSFGVGRVTSLFMHPLSFCEFLESSDNNNLISYLRENQSSIFDNTLHKKCLELYKEFSIIGGMPQIVANYFEERDYNKCMRLLDSLILGYQDDFAKYKTRIDPLKLRNVFYSSARQAGRKFMYTKVQEGESTSGLSDALTLLTLAGIVIKVNKSSGNGIPLVAEIDAKSFKCLPLDIGIYNRLLSTPISELIIRDVVSLINKGASAEVMVASELLKSQNPFIKPEIYYWSRDVAGSAAEVDFLVQVNSNIIPIEVKSGTKGQMQSLFRYMKEKNCNFGVRSSTENFGEIILSESDNKKIKIIPIYWIGEWVKSASF